MEDNEYTACAAYHTYCDVLRSGEKLPPVHLVDWDLLPEHLRKVWLDAVDESDEFFFTDGE